MKKLAILLAVLAVASVNVSAQSIKTLNSFKKAKLSFSQDYLGHSSGSHYFISTVSKRLVITDENFRHESSMKLPMKKKSRLHSDWVKIIDGKIYVAYSLNDQNFVKVISSKGELIDDFRLRAGISSNINENNLFSILEKKTGKVCVYKIDGEIKEIYTSDAYLTGANLKNVSISLITNINNTFTLVASNDNECNIHVCNYETEEDSHKEVKLPANASGADDVDVFIGDNGNLVLGILLRVENPDRKRNRSDCTGVKLHVFKLRKEKIGEEKVYTADFGSVIEEWKEEYKFKKYEGISPDLMIEQVLFSGEDIHVMMNVTDLSSSTTTTTGANNTTTTTTRWTRSNKAIILTKFSGGGSITKMVARNSYLTASGSSIYEQRAKSCYLLEREGEIYLLYNDYRSGDYKRKERDRVIVAKLDEKLNVEELANMIAYEMVKRKYALVIDFSLIKQEGDTYYFYGLVGLTRFDGGVVAITFD